MTRKFDYFVLFAEMRTGSNFLEANLNEFSELQCYGEAFNPHFIGQKDKMQMMGITMEERRDDPLRLIARMREKTEGLPGFRFFHDHDPRVLAHVLEDPRCAKIVLTRNPIESYVSRKIAAATGQWKLSDLRHQRSARAEFDAAEFEEHLERLQAFQVTLLHGLQVSGQTAFYIAYEDIQDVKVLNGLAQYLGIEGRIEKISDKLKKQNPEEISEKVVNFEEMEQALARLDRFNLCRTPNFEPRRGHAIGTFHAAAHTPLLYLPVRSGPEAEVLEWMAALDSAEVRGGFSYKTIRKWKQDNPGHRSFTVLRHPLARAHAAFCETILSGRYGNIAATLARIYGVALPREGEVQSLDAHRDAFLAFLRFLKGNLAGQSSIRVDSAWASQSAVLQGMSSLLLPDLILREDELGEGLATLAARFGRAAPALPEPRSSAPYALAEFYDEELEAAARDAYQRDYLTFGFDAWGG
ncbi:nodulation protein NodH [Plastorhodobacter daqingensis]|uniref:Nodulation protein NodH n=1 Tax=Plastorhodobacter daqingensis TaxID=1387281 RepID=A0ABW2UDG2_9RHOB